MVIADINIGKKEVRVATSQIRDERLVEEVRARRRLDPVYSQGRFIIDEEALMRTALEGLSNALGADAVTVTGIRRTVVVLGEGDEVLLPLLSQRDSLVQTMDDVACDRTFFDESGSVIQSGNVISQLAALKADQGQVMERAKCFMFLSDYIRFRLCGVKASDFYAAQDAGLTKVGERAWNDELFSRVGLENLFPPFGEDYSILGPLSDEVAKEVGYGADVWLTPSDPIVPASSVMAAGLALAGWRAGELATMVSQPVMGTKAYEAGVRNIAFPEGRLAALPFSGYELIGRLKDQSREGTNYDAIEAEARSCQCFDYIDIRDVRLKEGDILSAIASMLAEQGKEAGDRAHLIAVLYNSVARYVAGAATLLEELGGDRADEIFVFGQAAKDQHLNSLVCMMTGRRLITSTGFTASALSSLALLVHEGECDRQDCLDLIRKASGVSTYTRA